VNAIPWAIVSVDGLELGETPLSVPLKPGKHKVRASHRSFGTRERTVEIAPGEREVWNVQFQAR
jgi:hypothetical protein